MAGETWHVEYGGWREAWHRAAGPGFDQVSVGGRSYDTARDDLATLRPKTGQACAVCRGALPQAFSFCFGCGAALHDAPVPAEPPQSAPNAGRAHAGLPGLALADLASNGGGANPCPVSLPAGRLFAFVLAGRMVWRGWSDGFTPSLAQRPYVDPDGLVWQFGSLPQQGGRRTACFERLGTQSQPRHERVGGSVLTNGVLACRLLTLRHRAWVEGSPLDHDLPGQLDEYLVPVQPLGGEDCVLLAAPDRLSELVSAGEAGVSPPILSGLRYFDGRTLCDLARPLNLRSLSQLAVFVFDSRLYVYDSGENECVSWGMQERPT